MISYPANSQAAQASFINAMSELVIQKKSSFTRQIAGWKNI